MMNKILAFTLLFLIPAQAADVKISQLPELPAVQILPQDVLPIVDVSETTTKKVQVGSFDERYLAPQALLAPRASPVFTGNPQAPTRSPNNNSASVATTAYVDNAVSGVSGAVVSVFGRSGAITAQSGDYTKSQVGLGNVDNTSDVNKPISTATQNALNLKANLASPALTGAPTAPTQSPNDNSTKLATTQYVEAAIAAAPGGGITALTGEVTASGSGSVAATVTNSAVIGKVLTGYSSTTGTVAATDTILQAVGKLNGNQALYLPRSVATTKGDLFVATGASTIVRLPVGTDGQALVADSAQTTGVKWADAVSGGRTVTDFTTTVLTVSTPGDQVFNYVGSSAQVSGLNFFGTISGIADGTEITVIGTSDTNTMTINPIDGTDGMIMNGPIVLTRGVAITFQKSNTLARMVEIGRNN